MLLNLVPLLCSALFCLIFFPIVIIKFKRVGITGKDVNKPSKPEVAEMGGLVTTAGFSAGIILVIALKIYSNLFDGINLQYLLAALSTILTVVLIGILDDLIRLRQWFKAITPVFSAVPLMAMKVGDTAVSIPFLGQIDVGIVYSLVLVPIGITIAANGVNMLAGFNGLEAGMGTVSIAALAFIAFHLGENTALVMLLAGLGSLLATLRYNWYPAKVFIGDAGTFSIGVIIASAVIIGNFEIAGVIVMIPYAIDFFIKAANRLPSQGWEGVYRDGKLYCPGSKPKGFAQLVLKITGGVSESNLTLIFIGIQAVCSAGAIFFYL